MKNWLIGLVLIGLIGLGVIMVGCNETLDITGLTTTTTSTSTTTTTTLPKVSAPTFVLPAGIYETATFITITIEAGTTGADSIYYETDGSTPTAASTLYTGSFTIEASKTIEAIAVLSGYQNSDVATVDYEIWWWQSLGSGTDGVVFDLTSGSLYAAGRFTTGGGVTANHIAKWDGSTWDDLAGGIAGGGETSINDSIMDDQGNLYVGGEFTSAGGTSANRIARWDGSTWSALASGVDDFVMAFAYDNSDTIYVGGFFTTAGGVSASRLAKWTISTQTWEAIPTQLSTGHIRAVALNSSGNLVVGGDFTNIGGNPDADHIALWKPSETTWESLGSGTTNDRVETIVVDGDDVYVGGEFTSIRGVSANYIAKWNGSIWSALTSGTNNDVKALAINDTSDLYVGGRFTTAGGITANYLAKWDGTSWEAVKGSAMDDDVEEILIGDNGTLFVGGQFSTAGGIVVNSITKWGRK